MDNLTKTLPNDLELLKKIIQEQQLIIQCKEQTITLLEERLRCELIKRFAPKSEQHPGQGELFNEAEQLQAQSTQSKSFVQEPNQGNASSSTNKPKRRVLPADLPRETCVLDISEADKVCPCCGQLRHQMGESISEKLIFIPAQIKVIEYRRPKYACRHCEQTDTENTIKQAPMPDTPIPKSFASSSLLAQIILGKYQYSLPLYRQEAIFSQFNIELNRKTMSDWIIKSAQLLTPFYDKLKQRLLTQPIIQADETSLTVINNDKLKSYLWVYCCGADSPSESNKINDAIDRLIKITRADGKSNAFEYNGYNKVTKVTDEQGRITRYDYVPNLHVISRKINPDGSEVNYQYNNAQLNLTDIINETGQRYHIDYYPNGLVSQETSFEGLTTSYQYDLGGHLLSKTEYDKQGNAYTTTYQRTNTGELLQKTLPDGKQINYRYNPAGKLLSVEDGNWPINYEYDLAGRLTTEHQGWATLRYQYSPLGILSQCKLPDGNIIDYKHTKGGQLSQVNLNGQKLTEHFYNLGQEVERQQGALTSIYDYDDEGRLKSHFISNQHKTLYKRHYQYSPAGNLEQIEDSRKGKREYFYDPLDRLTKVRGDITEDLIHDPAGNLLSQEHNVHHVNMQGNRLLMQGDKHFSYDDFGCLIEERRGQNQQLVTHYQYDSQHQLQTATLPDGTVAEYQYDAFGRRIRKTVTDKAGTKTKTEYIWQGSKIVAESSKQHYQSYLYEPGTFKPLALLKGKGKEAQVYYYQLDHLGTPQELTNTHGSICWSARYKAYGNLAVLDIAEVNNPLRFQGQYYDQETGLHYNRYRYYNPTVGRYMTPDPIKLAGGLNNYQYTKNPVGYVDPLGLSDLCPLKRPIDDADIPTGITRTSFEEKIKYFRDNVTSSNYETWKKQLAKDLKAEGLSEAQANESIREIFYRGSLEKNENIFGGGKDWGKYWSEVSGTTHPGDPMHAHHLVEKVGGGVAGAENRTILQEVGINPNLQRENFTWAPNKVKGQHGQIPQAELNRRLQPVRGNKEGIEQVLKEWAIECQNRGK